MSDEGIKVVEKTNEELKKILIDIIRNDNFYVHEVADLTYDIEAGEKPVTVNVLSVRYDIAVGQEIPDKDMFDQAMDAVKEQFYKPFK